MKCPRCGKPHNDKDLSGEPSKMCAVCQCRNLFDGLGLKTPPALLDKHTKNPALTEEEFEAWYEGERKRHRKKKKNAKTKSS